MNAREFEDFEAKLHDAFKATVHKAKMELRAVFMDPQGPDRSEWDRAWNHVRMVFGDTECYNPQFSEWWMYMGTWRLDSGQYVHEFKHRALPPENKYRIFHVPASVEWLDANELHHGGIAS